MHRIGRWALWAWAVSCLPVLAQVPPPSPPGPPPAPPTIKLYVDCSISGCDFDFMRTEIPFVDHVRNRQDADVVVLVTSLSTGSGGTEVTLQFTGHGPFQGINDELKVVSGQNDSEDVRRRDLVQTLKLGLARYAARTALGRNLQISERKPPPGQAPGAPRSGKDPWDYWVLRVSLNGNAWGESATKDLSVYGSASANRITEAWKVNVAGSVDYSENKYTFSDGTGYTSIRRNYSSSAYVVRSLTDHWSVGAYGSVGTSSYYNQDLAIRAWPAVEYDWFPYSEATRRQFTFQYLIGYNHFDYHEVTIFDRQTDSLPSQTFLASLNLKQAWGSIEGDTSVSQYLTEPSKWNAGIGGYASLKLLKGLSVSLSGSTSWIRDQVYLPRGSATNEEVLVQQRQLATSYSYSVYVGISYSFGSIYNNVVNPRMKQITGSSFMYY